MQANPDKFQFMIFSRTPLGEQTIVLDGNSAIKSKHCVKIHGVYVDEKLNFSKHFSKFIRNQLNSLMP